jgi:myo-inositol-1(or 4)-monophosphatase
VTDDEVLAVFAEVCSAVRTALDGVADWGLTGTTAGQHHSDLVADEVALGLLGAAGVAVLSEESGRSGPAGAPLVVVVDPLDGSTNAAQGIPWYATSLCLLDAEGPRVAMVADQARSVTFSAVRGRGAWRDGVAIEPTSCRQAEQAMVALSGFPARSLGWRQYRALGAAALDLCLVASGVVDAYVDCSRDAHGPWDYLGGMLVCQEAGAVVVDADGRDLAVTGHDDRRTPVAAATVELLDVLVGRRRELDSRH